MEQQTVIPVLYHGTCEDSAASLVKNGWQPNSWSAGYARTQWGIMGAHGGQPRYLYLSTDDEDALWFAQEKGCDTVVAVHNVPLDHLIPDPEDAIGDTVAEELAHHPAKLALTKSLPASHFRIVRGTVQEAVSTGVMEAEQRVHPFAAAGLGAAPFRCVGAYSLPSPSLAEHNPAAYANAMRDMPKGYRIGTCAYCGMGLVHNFLIRSADDKRFVVGSECVAKTHDKGLTNSVKAEATKARRLAKHAARQAEWEKWKVENADRLAAAQAEREAREAALQAERNATRAKWEFLLRYIQGDSPFVSAMRDNIERGEAPHGRAASILADIYAKAHGRRGSKGYDAALDDFESRTGISV